MRVLMLGWEYPPHISGGLGTACEGLTKALSSQDVELIFVVPKVFGDEEAHHMEILDPESYCERTFNVEESKPVMPRSRTHVRQVHGVNIVEVESYLKPYVTPKSFHIESTIEELFVEEDVETPEHQIKMWTKNINLVTDHYGTDLFSEVARYAENIARLSEHLDFDVIHAHDWMTYPAAMKVKSISGQPIVLHVHSLEFDRSGENVNPQINAIEKAGLKAADRVITVSHYTKSLVVQKHHISEDRITVVHNGITQSESLEKYNIDKDPKNKIVLFLGRITFQKGPEYFVEAAAKIIPYYPNVKFVMSGSGDMLEDTKKRVRYMGIEKYFEFTGFLKGKDVERMYTLADLYVMPSVSEPFGIAPLEAMSCDTPIIISKQSGVSEVLRHALKVDFWDTEMMAEMMLSVLENGVLSNELKDMSKQELLNIHWDAAAQKTKDVYNNLIERERNV